MFPPLVYFLIFEDLLWLINILCKLCYCFSFPFQVMYTVQFPITGFSMLLSAGTFLYVATVHVLSEITQSSTHSPSDSTPSSGSHTNNGNKLSRVELFLVVSGAFLPLLFNAIHSHSHWYGVLNVIECSHNSLISMIIIHVSSLMEKWIQEW